MSETEATSRPVGRLLFEPGADEEALADRRYREWLRVGLSTEPADRERAERALRRAYRLAGLGAPRIRWVASPRELAELASPRERGRSSWASPIAPIWEALHARARVPTPIRPLCSFSLWYRLSASIEWGFHRPVWTEAMRAGGAYLPRFWVLGQVDVPRVACDRFVQELGLDEAAERSERLRLREELTRSAGWVWGCEGLCVVSDRPAEIHTEEARWTLRIHREDGPAVRFRDGFRVWAWHGTAVPRHVVEDPPSIDPDEVRDEPDPNRRRALLDRFGLLRFLEEAGAQVVDAAPGAADGVPQGLRRARLLRLPWGDDGEEPLVAVSLVDPASGTRRAIRVPPDVTTVREAVAWTFGLEAEEYAPQVEM